MLSAVATAFAAYEPPEDDGWDDADDDAYDDDEAADAAEAAALGERLGSAVRLTPLETRAGGGSHHTASNDIKGSERKVQEQRKHTGLTRDERATTEQVLDPRTRLLLFKLLNSGALSVINGCVSTGKEANVYHAEGRDGELAIKVYKTSILIFKDRDRYVTGEFRFRHGYCKSNPRKMVRMWAEKEMRNYRRLALCGVPCPEPLMLKEHVLVMRFLGEDGWAAPRLKDANLRPAEMEGAWRQVAMLLRQLFHACRLVHADFSEYNLLWHKRAVYVIDVSQSVEHDHPNALNFLRADCEHSLSFFRSSGVTCSTQQLFEFVVDPTLKTDEQQAAAFEALATRSGAAEVALQAGQRGEGGGADGGGEGGEEGGEEGADEAEAEAAVRDAVFMQVHIPRTLDEVPMKQAERDVAAAAAGRGDDLAYTKLMGFNADLSVAKSDAAAAPQAAASKSEGGEVGDGEGDKGDKGEEDDESDEESGEEGEEGEEYRERRRRGLHRFEDKETKAARKADVKSAQREARQHKVPKHVKKAKKGGGKKK